MVEVSSKTAVVPGSVRVVRVVRWVLVGVQAFAAVGAWYGGIGLIADNSIGMLPEWLQGTPLSPGRGPGSSC